jgi:hypothetical protein
MAAPGRQTNLPLIRAQPFDPDHRDLLALVVGSPRLGIADAADPHERIPTMPSTGRQVRNMTLRTKLWAWPVLAAVVALAVACGPKEERQPAPQLTGTYNGVDDAGKPIVISFQQDGSALTGHGRWGDQEIGLSGLTAPAGPMVVSFASGYTASGQVSLAADGTSVTLRGMGAPVTLGRGGEPLAGASGRFAGRFAAKGPMRLRLELAQSGDLLAGTGFVDGRPVAVAGKVTEPGQARGFVLFSDESRNAVTVSLADDGGALSVRGLGRLIEMTRD